MAITERAFRPETLEELERQLSRLYPQAKVIPFDAESTATSKRTTRKDFLESVDGTTMSIVMPLKSERQASGCTISSNRKFDEHEIRFARSFARVFNDDLRSAPQWGRNEELWLSLQQTRLSRVIARFSPFHTAIFVKWLRSFENALGLRYERQPFSTHLMLTKQLKWIKGNQSIDYVGFREPMSLSTALFDEKWTRALAADGEVVLVGLGHDRGVSGVMYVKCATPKSSKTVAPHTRLRDLCSALVPGTTAFLASPHGDLRVMFPSGAAFVKTQGHWAMSNLQLLHETLAGVLHPLVSDAVTRLAVDLSYEGHGALFCCVENPSAIKDMVPDYFDNARVNLTLRSMSRKLNITESGHQVILKRIATIDGAVLFSPDGKVLDAASMISDPTESILANSGFTKRSRFSGARSTAAWNASLHGIAIKISEDGPITVFRNGTLILQVG